MGGTQAIAYNGAIDSSGAMALGEARAVARGGALTLAFTCARRPGESRSKKEEETGSGEHFGAGGRLSHDALSGGYGSRGFRRGLAYNCAATRAHFGRPPASWPSRAWPRTGPAGA